MLDSELTLIRFPHMKDKVIGVLSNQDAAHYDRLWMVGFLKSVGYDLQSICDIIHVLNDWSNYDVRMSYNQVNSVFRTNTTTRSCISLPNSAVGAQTHTLNSAKATCSQISITCDECIKTGLQNCRGGS